MCRHRVHTTFQRIARELGLSLSALMALGAPEVIRMRRRS